jgi:Na+-driven multidrug efflux pump
MQNAVSPMVVDITVNITNLVASVFFAFWGGMGFSGIAMGTFVAQYTGIVVSLIFLFTKYKKLFKYINVKASLKLREMKHFFVINSDLFLRSVSFLFIYVGFTSLAAKYGDVELAVCTIMMKIVLLYAYFVDGFAYAGEALVGRFIGPKIKNRWLKQ